MMSKKLYLVRSQFLHPIKLILPLDLGNMILKILSMLKMVILDIMKLILILVMSEEQIPTNLMIVV